MTAALLRRAARALRNPYLCNWSEEVAHTLAVWLDQAAEEEVERAFGVFHPRSHSGAVVTARALLRSFGHECADTDEPCRTCAMTPEPMTEGDQR